MKISTLFFVLLAVGAVFFMFATMAQEDNERFTDDQINISAFDGKYDYVSDINESIDPMVQSFRNIQDTDSDKGWFKKLIAGIAAMPYAVILVPALLFKGFLMTTSLTSGMLVLLGVSSYFILFGVVWLVVWGISKLIEVYQRWPI